MSIPIKALNRVLSPPSRRCTRLVFEARPRAKNAFIGPMDRVRLKSPQALVYGFRELRVENIWLKVQDGFKNL